MLDVPIPANIRIKELLKLISDDELAVLSRDSGVDHQVKSLFGRSMFYLILYGLATCERTSLRGLEDIFNSNRFKVLFSLDATSTTRYNSLSDRLATMELSFFEKAYQMVYSEFSQKFSQREAEAHHVVRVDSTMVAETANKLAQGMRVGSRTAGRQVKYTVCMDDLFPSSVEVFTSQSELSEDRTIPRTILKYTDPGPSTVFVFDRGVSSRQAFADIDARKWSFVTRMKAGARYNLLQDLPLGLQEDRAGNLEITSDQLIQLYDAKGKAMENRFRLVKALDDRQKEFFFLSNLLEVPPAMIIALYKKRWDIEVFFRFIKQELNFGHFMSTNINGIKIILYMTLILSMLIHIYKKSNAVGYKTAKRRVAMELEDLVTIQIVIACGGNPDIVFRGP